MSISQADTRNLLLRSLAPEDFAQLQPHLTRTQMHVRDRLVEADKLFEHVYFPEGGVVSVVMRLADGGEMEVGIVGREGVLPVAALLGAETSPHEIFVQVDGADALCVPYLVLRDLMREHTSLREALQRFAMSFLVQTTTTAVSAGNHPIEQRLARWLLMCHDRLEGDDLKLTHEFVGLMLAVRRSSVTVTLHVLEGMGAISAKRGTVVVTNRELLEELAGEAYGEAEEQYRKLIGPFPLKGGGRRHKASYVGVQTTVTS